MESVPTRAYHQYCGIARAMELVGERWAMLVLPQVLQLLMRHESITTTMRFYAMLDAQKTSEICWGAFLKRKRGNKKGNAS